MITKIEIKNYRSCIDCSLYLQPHLSVLIGPNGSGKTNILSALLLLRRLAEEEGSFGYQEETPTTKPQIKVSFDIAGKKAIWTALVEAYTNESNEDVVVAARQRWHMKDFTGNHKHLKIPLSLARHLGGAVRAQPEFIFYHTRAYTFQYKGAPDIPAAATKAMQTIAQLAVGMRYYGASQFTNPANCPVSFEIEKEGTQRRGLRLRGHAKFLFDLYTEFKRGTSRYHEFFEIIGPGGIGLVDKIDFQEIVTSSVDYSVRSGGRIKERKRDKMLVIPQFTIGTHELSPNQLSEGTLKTITLLFYLVTEASSVLLIEEPEVCVHHGLLSSILELIKTYSQDRQIIISTHSDFVLDHVLPENVYAVSCTPREGTKVAHIPRSMSRRELNALRKYLEHEGNLGEYWRHGALEK